MKALGQQAHANNNNNNSDSNYNDNDDEGGGFIRGRGESNASSSNNGDEQSYTPAILKTLGESDTMVNSVLHSPTYSSNGEVCTLNKKGLDLWSVEAGTAGDRISSLEVGDGHECARAKWDPHHANNVGVLNKGDVSIVDVRNNSVVGGVKNAHKTGGLSLDYNPNRPYFLATGGEDGLIKFWDLRMSGAVGVGVGVGVEEDKGKVKENENDGQEGALKVLKGHTHWVNDVVYNPFHDQLLVSGGSDGMANLWRVSGISSAPLLELDESTEGSDKQNLINPTDSNNKKSNDVCVEQFIQDNNESVYNVAWSSCDAWLFCSIGYDGNVVLNHVSSEEKYKILL